MVRVRSLIFILVCVAQVGCSRASKSSESQISIIAPQSLRAKNQGAFNAMPTDRTACYAVNITGATTAFNITCSPPVGLTAGFVASGQALKASVAKNKTIAIELYLYLLPSGASVCPGFAEALAKNNIANAYLVGTATGISTAQDETNVTIEAAFPGAAQNVAQQLSLPSTCMASYVPTGHPYGVSAGETLMTDGSGGKLIGRLGSANQNGAMSAGDGSKIMIKRAGVVR